ncbi:NAD dependent epimerase/dehydratase family protein [Leptospira inadai serovar Lyme str. 10]|uniref:GDP-L-fucose synthase n=2 Tax=Leptospira inadai serovar Lyme TaxID=293084 RepID=V6HBI4_9LEPT|nr:GDP-L-fucose synthase [Leptospira inadai]EQA37011.1 NAD dependent epimerase/dehydratase family protein [Leptospira inadai serovar Lyme str. 10]PNV76695.1 GDP-fucose synthetase [Leptospira inadai serovar Lyme]
MEKDARIFIAGIYGMVGSAIDRVLREEGFKNVIGHSSEELNLLRQEDVERFFKEYRPDYVFIAAARVGGIYANDTYPADFIYNNLQIQNNLIHSSYIYRVKKLLFLGSSCIYPKYAEQPIKESSLLTGLLEPTNEAYAIAKIAGLKMCEFYNKQFHTQFISAMPTNLYGIGDNYNAMNSHVLPALIRRFHEAKVSNSKQVVMWGTGKPLREFLFVDDLADACVFLMKNYLSNETINVGSGCEVSIRELAEIVKEAVGYQGEITLDSTKPDGTPRKLLDSSRLRELGWKPKTDLNEGIRLAYSDFVNGNVRK